MTPTWESNCGKVRLWCADCLDVMHSLTANALLTDPPYGLAEKWQGGWKTVCGRLWDGSTPSWDEGISGEAVSECLKLNIPSIIWGGNYYPLPPSRCWLIWDKKQVHSGAECEMAWSNLDMPTRVFRMSRTDAYVNYAEQPKSHPSEKPLMLIRWCVGFIDGETILDPFMGSGTTGIACIRTGRRFLGIEKDERYFEIAKRRIQDELGRTPLFDNAPEIQPELFA